VKLGLL
jgi:hypothetical protein